jgi:hypothetical protein
MQASSHSRPEAKLGRFQQSLILAAIVAFTFFAHALSPVTTSTDSAWTFHVASSILLEHNIDLDEYRNLINLQLDYRLRLIRGHIYYYYPAATPLLVAPVVWLINKLYPLSHPTDFYTYLAEHAPDDRTARLEKIVASGIVGLAAGLMYLTCRRYLGVFESSAVALIFAFSTSMWSTASRALWQHGPSVLFLTLALYLLVAASDRPWAALCIGLVLGYAYAIRPTNSLSVAFLGLYLLINRQKQFWLFGIGLLAILVPYVVQNWLTYGNIFPPYSYQLFERLGTPATIAEGLVGTLVSPNRGLLVFTPIFLFSAYGALRALTPGAPLLSRLEPYLIAIVLMHWITTSIFEDWGGAWSIGPRYMVDMIPYLTYFFIPLFQRQALARPSLKFAFASLLILSTLIQLHCATSIDPFMWNGKPRALVEAPERKWDWGDLQFLRGFCPHNPLEGMAPACWFGQSG